MDRTAGILVIVIVIVAMYLYSQHALTFTPHTTTTVLPAGGGGFGTPGIAPGGVPPALINTSLSPLEWGSIFSDSAVQGTASAGTTVNVYQGTVPPVTTVPPALPLPGSPLAPYGTPGYGYPGVPTTPQQAAAQGTGSAINSLLTCKGVFNCVAKGGIAAALTALTFGFL